MYRRKKPIQNYARKRSFQPAGLRVNPADAKKEMKEHPWITKEQGERIAADHTRQEQPKEFFPKNVKKEERKIYAFFKIRTAGQWSADLLSTEAGKILAEGHWENVKRMLQANPPKSKTAAQQLQKKALQTPQQQFVLMHEASMTGPLSTEGFNRYLTLFKQLFPKHYASMNGFASTANCAIR